MVFQGFFHKDKASRILIRWNNYITVKQKKQGKTLQKTSLILLIKSTVFDKREERKDILFFIKPLSLSEIPHLSVKYR